MKISLNWLADYVTWEGTPEDLARKLTLAGLNVEAIEPFTLTFPGVVVGEVRTCERHPDADKLSLTTVFDGEDTRQVVCGAPNVRAGLKVLLATVGAVLPGDFKIKKSKIRGVESQGMICSASELGLSDESDGIMELDSDAVPGTPADELYGYRDVVLDVEVTPNRPDWLSHYGVAREVAALEGTLLDSPVVWSPAKNAADKPEFSVEIDDFAACPRYTAHLAHGLVVGPSPRWMRQRLLAVGLRPISNVVDITNYVLLELGQPLHAFDRDRLNGKKISVRRARAAEKIRTLDDQERELLAEDLVIADANGAVALAGVMGGASSEVTADTQDILLESAAFAPGLVRATSRRLQLASESSYRFERGADWDCVQLGARRALALLQEHAGARISAAVVDRRDPDRKEQEPVSLRVEQVNRLLGTDLTAPEVIDRLQALGLKCQPLGQASDRDSRHGKIMVTVPSFRRDILQEVDLIEEVARLHGFEHGDPDHRFRSRAGVETREEDLTISALRRLLAGMGYFEVVTSSFQSREDSDRLQLPDTDPRREMLAILNPHHGGETLLRTTALPGLLEVVRRNLNADRTPPLRLFQYGREFLPAGNRRTDIRHEDETLLPEETHVLQFAVVGDLGSVYGDLPAALMESKALMTDLGDAVRVPLVLEPLDGEPFLKPGQQWTVRTADGVGVGWLGALAPAVRRAFEIDEPVMVGSWNLAVSELTPEPRRYTPFSRFPAAKRDLSLVVPDGVTYAAIDGLLRDHGGPLLRSWELFDHFRGGSLPSGVSSLGIRLQFQSAKGSLKGKAADMAVDAVRNRLEGDLGVTIRA